MKYKQILRWLFHTNSEANSISEANSMPEDRMKGVHEIRQIISGDLHDIIAPGLVLLRMQTQEMKMKTGHEDLSSHLDALSRTADDLIRNTREMIWTLHPRNDLLDNTVNFIGEYFLSRIESSGVDACIYYPDRVPDIGLPLILMRSLVRCTTEATDFMVRNSTGTQADLHIDVTEENIRVRIRDNSTAGQLSTEESSRVLTGIDRKMAAVGGTCSLFSSLAGSTPWVQAPFPNC